RSRPADQLGRLHPTLERDYPDQPATPIPKSPTPGPPSRATLAARRRAAATPAAPSRARLRPPARPSRRTARTARPKRRRRCRRKEAVRPAAPRRTSSLAWAARHCAVAPVDTALPLRPDVACPPSETAERWPPHSEWLRTSSPTRCKRRRRPLSVSPAKAPASACSGASLPERLGERS